MGKKTFNTDAPIAYFLTWTTYGTWLPGDARGWNDKAEPGLQPPNPFLMDCAESLMREGLFRLSLRNKGIVEETIRQHCILRNWFLHAVNVRTNHVHVVVTAAGYAPSTVRDQFKSWCTRKLKAAGECRTNYWTEGASCRWINHQTELEATIEYVVVAQDRKSRDEM